jgi:hypothetical protein
MEELAMRGYACTITYAKENQAAEAKSGQLDYLVLMKDGSSERDIEIEIMASGLQAIQLREGPEVAFEVIDVVASMTAQRPFFRAHALRGLPGDGCMEC